MSITVLLADDHKVVCDGLAALLNTESDIKVVGQADNGQEALRKVRELQPDIVVMDINMPGINGLEVAHQIVEEALPTRVIVLSMYSSGEHIFNALKNGAKGYLLKEAAGSELIEAIRAVHAGCRYLSRKITDEVIDHYLHLRINVGDDSLLSRLSPREREVLQHVVNGLSSAEIAKLLCLSTKTIETYRSRLMQKLEIHDLPGLVRFAIQHGLTPLE